MVASHYELLRHHLAELIYLLMLYQFVKLLMIKLE